MKVFHETQLPWPPGKPWTETRKSGQFQSSLDGALRRVESSVDAFTKKGSAWRTTELWIFLDGGQLGAKGRFLANKYPTSPGVVVQFDLDGKQYTIAVDRYITAIQNLCAIAATIEGLRTNERHGVMTMSEMLSTFEALPMVSSALRKAWWEVLGVDRNASEKEITAAYRALAKVRHPDANGTAQEWQELQEAYEQALGNNK